MPVFDIAFSLNRTMVSKADTYEEAEAKIKASLEQEGINLETYEFEPYDVVEIELDDDTPSPQVSENL